jgi:uncharacterized protein Veg
MKDQCLVLQASLGLPHKQHSGMALLVNSTFSVHFFVNFDQAGRSTEVHKYSRAAVLRKNTLFATLVRW